MKKLLMFLFIGLMAHSQKYHGYVVTNANDTIKCKFKVQTNLFNDDIYYPSSRTIVTLNDAGEKVKYKPNQLKSYYLQGPNIKNYRFVSLKEDDNKIFYHEVQRGKISLYYYYDPNINGGDPIKTVFILKEGQLIKVKGSKMREKIGVFLTDYPDVYATWLNSNRSFDLDQMEYIIELYNKNFRA